MYRFDNLDPFAARRAKLAELRNLGIDPYPARVPEHLPIAEARKKGEDQVTIEEAKEVGVVGRILAQREQGALFLWTCGTRRERFNFWLNLMF